MAETLKEKLLVAIVLPEELIVEILSWLPVEPLMRFRCVSKTWNSLIFHPTLVKLHLQKSSLNTHLLLSFINDIRRDWKLYYGRATLCSTRARLENPLSIIDDCYYSFNDNSYVCGSCNGLVCLHSIFDGYEFEEHCVQFWNPATRIISQVSPRLRLGSISYHKIGFGFDDLSNTYKVVLVTWDIESKNLKLRVHCLGDTCWRDVVTCPGFSILEQSPNGQFVGGTLNWLALRSLSFTYPWKTVTNDQLVIFSYDLRSETYKCLLMPNDDFLKISKYDTWFGVVKGCLCLSYNYRETDFAFWIMREFGVEKSWTPLLKVSYVHLEGFSLLPVWMSENEEDVIFLESVGAFTFVLYYRRDNGVYLSEVFCNKIILGSYDYVQSLVLPY